MAERKLVEGKVYFRDTRTNAIYDYESHLSNIPHMKRFVHEASKAQKEEKKEGAAGGDKGQQAATQQTAKPQTAKPEK